MFSDIPWNIKAAIASSALVLYLLLRNRNRNVFDKLHSFVVFGSAFVVNIKCGFAVRWVELHKSGNYFGEKKCVRTLALRAFFDASLISCFGAFCFFLFFWYLDAICATGMSRIPLQWH